MLDFLRVSCRKKINWSVITLQHCLFLLLYNEVNIMYDSSHFR